MRTTAVVGAAMALVAMLASCTPASSDEPDRIVRPTAPRTSPPPSASSPPVPDVSPDATASAAPGAGDASCVDGVLAIRGTDLDASFAGECDLVQIEGASLDVDLERARINRVVASGDRLEIDLGSVDSLEVTGQSADVDAVVVGTLAVAGDRNVVDADEIGAVSVSGNDNRVEADRLGAVTQSGDRNEIGAG
ncbi:DUF3060 domain-containing protein [Microbacterium arborescens]|uniref:DUF3060 domain-containing protein n=1 Tax=Microbacterium arborescens TaxID=33883 RepID=UPI0025A14899|nr:DUF3060 domain-containing protein [Microbacterium arborescens]WJM17166.1 hypothetical protein QUC20_07670 [Microbacterium arborescens]